MKKLVILLAALAYLSLVPVFCQQVYKLGLNQPPPLAITLLDSINEKAGEVVNLDTWFHVDGDISYNRGWKFRYGSQVLTITNPIYTITSEGVFYLTVISANGCTILDSIALNIVTSIEDNYPDKDSRQSIRVYPNPNTGTFDIIISDCQAGSSVEIINSLGVQFLNMPLECNNNEYSGKIMMPEGESGIYYVLVKKDSKIIYRQKVIIIK